MASARPGASTGPTVIDGHVDSAELGLGALHRLQELAAGDLVVLVTAAGTEISYRVTARHTYEKAAGLPSELFARTGSARLVMITGGGSFDSTTKSYQDNVVVFAMPVATSGPEGLASPIVQMTG